MNSNTILETCCEIIQRVVDGADGKMPADRAAFVALILERFARPENIPAALRDRLTLAQWEAARNAYALGLTIGCDCVARDRDALWTN